ncbi:MAG TPA: hypothetical protein VGN69_11180 [Solirubrobacteraceae bacterium]|jgi:hypothetical protein|nr:hypothetical protein [Solirubrobacteraceae bacterium]
MTRLASPILRLACVSTLAVLAVLGSPSGALAARGDAIIRECLKYDRITGTYSQADYRYAISHLPTDVNEYSDCGDVIRRAQVAAAGNHGGTGGGSGGGGGLPGSDPLAGATPAERAAVATAIRSGGAPQPVGDELVHPGLIAMRTSATLNSLPTPLLVLALALLLAAMAGGGRALLTHVRARRVG